MSSATSDPAGREAAIKWTKPNSCNTATGPCVEVADLPDGRVGVRNSKDPRGPILRFTPEEWRAFLGGARLGEFDGFGAT